MSETMIHALAADTPAAPDLYGRLAGVWDVGNRYYDEDKAEWRTGTAVWTFGWVLDGRAVQDVMWFTDVDGNRSTGSTMRLYDPDGDHWHVVWFSPYGRIVTLIGRAGPDGGILQEGRRNNDGRPVRWEFTEVTDTSFRWLGHISDDDGRTWRLEQEMRARRRPGGAQRP
jgi:hypothetical protein